MPKYLIVHIKRFEYPLLEKDMSIVQYKHALDLTKYSAQDIVLDKDQEATFIYELMGVIIHKGAEMD